VKETSNALIRRRYSCWANENVLNSTTPVVSRDGKHCKKADVKFSTCFLRQGDVGASRSADPFLVFIRTNPGHDRLIHSRTVYNGDRCFRGLYVRSLWEFVCFSFLCTMATLSWRLRSAACFNRYVSSSFEIFSSDKGVGYVTVTIRLFVSAYLLKTNEKGKFSGLID